jgi:hypothetical protein
MKSMTVIDSRDIQQLTDEIQRLLVDGPVSVKLSGRKARSLSQNALSWMFYTEISRWLMSKGKDFATPQWTHDAMCHTFLGHVDVMDTDVITGVSTRRSELRGTSGLDVGEFTLYLDLVYHWALNYGIMLTVPEDCEYQRLKKVENGYD